MPRTAESSASRVFTVQSPVAETISSGRGAMVAAISTLLVSRRSVGAFSHRQPPCMCSEIMFTGTATLTRSSTAASRNVCVPPPDSPVTARASAWTSGSDCRKSRLRIEFHSCSPARLMPHNVSRLPPKVCGS